MPISINRKIFDRVKNAIAESGRINMLSWAEDQDSTPAESVNEIRELPFYDAHEPFTLSAALLIDGAEGKYELESARLPLFSLTHWPLEEQVTYDASRPDAERNQVVLRRMDDWAAEIEARQSARIPGGRDGDSRCG